MAPKDVQYGFDVVDALPERELRASVLEDAVEQIKLGAVEPGKAVIIARYKNRTAASAAANTLRKRHGQPDAEGFKFECHRVDDRSALFVVFDPSWITDEGVASHAAELKADKEKKAEQARARRANKAAEKAAPAPAAGNGDAAAKGKVKQSA